MNIKKGFTLIELLAVIVVLGIIAAITIPLVDKTITNSEKESFRLSVEGIYKAIENEQAQDGTFKGNRYSFEDKVLQKVEENGDILNAPVEITLSGKIKSGSGQALTEYDGKTIIAIENGEWCAYNDELDSTIRVKDGKCDLFNYSKQWTSEMCFTFDEKQGMITRYDLELCDFTNVVIPARIDGYAVRSVGPGAFANAIEQYCTLPSDARDFSRVQVPLNYIWEDDSYRECYFTSDVGISAIKKMDFSSAKYLEKIYYSIFGEIDTEITEIKIENIPNLHTIDNYAFMDVNPVEEIEQQIILKDLPNLTNIGRYAFASNISLREFRIFNFENLPNIANVGRSAFCFFNQEKSTIRNVSVILQQGFGNGCLL